MRIFNHLVYRKVGILPWLLCAILLSFVPVVRGDSVSFDYDSLNRITKVSYSSGSSISYAYDKGGNRTIMSMTAPNRNPIAGDDSFGTVEDQSHIAPAVRLLANDSDPDGDALSIASVVSASANGASIVFDSGVITYTPATGFSGEDQFTYTVSDGRGGTDVGTVVVNVRASNTPPLNQATITITPDGKNVRFSGIPGQGYVVQAADAVEGPWGPVSGTLIAGATGIIDYSDREEPAPATRFYRIVSVP